MPKIRLEDGQFGWSFIIRNVDTDETILIQTDYDYPSVASAFGWIPCNKCCNTDGTVDCVHKTASQMIVEARDYLREHINNEIEDPGYFS